MTIQTKRSRENFWNLTSQQEIIGDLCPANPANVGRIARADSVPVFAWTLNYFVDFISIHVNDVQLLTIIVAFNIKTELLICRKCSFFMKHL